MKNIFYFTLIIFVFTLTAHGAEGQNAAEDRWESSSMGSDTAGGELMVDIPSKLPVPANQKWMLKLREMYNLEKASLAQFEADQQKFKAFRPYYTLIPQKEDNIKWLQDLFKAYGLAPEERKFLVEEPKSLDDAYLLSINMERQLVSGYELLVKNAEDADSAEVLNAILLQTRWHQVRFEHAFTTGEQYERRRMAIRRGMMGPNALDKSTAAGPGMIGRGNRSVITSVDMNEAKNMLDEYLRSTRNPNLKLGNIKDNGNNYEAEILTRDGSLADKILVNKRTGFMRSAY